MMSESEPEGATAPAGSAAGDPLAARLLAVQRALAALSVDADSEARLRLNHRFAAICAALKMPGASRVRCIRRLNQLMAEAEQVRAGNTTSPHKDV
jgi:hypothetical protein